MPIGRRPSKDTGVTGQIDNIYDARLDRDALERIGMRLFT